MNKVLRFLNQLPRRFVATNILRQEILLSVTPDNIIFCLGKDQMLGLLHWLRIFTSERHLLFSLEVYFSYRAQFSHFVRCSRIGIFNFPTNFFHREVQSRMRSYCRRSLPNPAFYCLLSSHAFQYLI